MDLLSFIHKVPPPPKKKQTNKQTNKQQNIIAALKALINVMLHCAMCPFNKCVGVELYKPTL
jgi:hypothetical protein